jgi:hypothetical protein
MGKSLGRARLFTCALVISVALTLLLRRLFGQTPPADFGDLYLLGLLFVSYYGSWRPSAVLLAISTGLSVFLLRPLDWTDAFQIVSYTVSGAVVIWIMALLKRRCGVGLQACARSAATSAYSSTRTVIFEPSAPPK